MNITKAGILFIESFDPISKIKMAISNQKFSAIGFYSSSSIPGNPEIQLFLLDIMDLSLSTPIWAQPYILKNSNIQSNNINLGYHNLQSLPIRKMMRKELLPIFIDGEIDIILTDKIKTTFRKFILNLQSFNFQKTLNPIETLIHNLNQILSKSIHESYKERFGEYLGTHYFNDGRRNGMKNEKTKNEKPNNQIKNNNQITNNQITNNQISNNQIKNNNQITNNQITNNQISNNQITNNENTKINNEKISISIESLIDENGSDYFGELVEVFIKGDDQIEQIDFNTPVYRSYLHQIMKDISDRILIDSNFLNYIIDIFSNRYNSKNNQGETRETELDQKSKNQIDSVIMLDNEINTILDAINTKRCPIVNLYQLMKISDHLKDEIKNEIKDEIKNEIKDEIKIKNPENKKSENKKSENKKSENKKYEKRGSNVTNKYWLDTDNFKIILNNKILQSYQGSENKSVGKKKISGASFPGLITIDGNEIIGSNEKNFQLRYERGNKTTITIPLINADLSQFNQEELMEISILLDQNDDSNYDSNYDYLKAEIAERIAQNRSSFQINKNGNF